MARSSPVLRCQRAVVVSGVDPSDDDITNPIPRTAWARDVPLPEPPAGQSLEVTRRNRGMAPLPVARVHAPWWKRWLAWLTSEPIAVHCLSCDMRLGVAGEVTDRELVDHERLCRWIHELEQSRVDERVTMAGAGEALDKLNAEIHQATVRRVIKMPIAGPGRPMSR